MYALKADFRQSFSITFHSRLTSIALWLFIALVLGIVLAAQFSARQPATVALDVGISVIRLALPLLAILLVQELFSREFERKIYLTSFTYPRGRISWLLGRFAAILLIIVAVLILMAAILAALTLYISGDYEQATPVSVGFPFAITLIFIALDLLVAIAIAILLAVSASTTSFVLIGTIGFMLIARSYTPIIELLRENPYAVSTLVDPQLYQDSLGMLAFILPDLGRLDARMAALYNQTAFIPSEWPLLVTSILCYVAALLGLSVWILNKREFN